MLHFSKLFFVCSLYFLSEGKANTSNIFLCYGKVAVEKIMNYEYVILEGSHYTKEEVDILKKNNTHVTCYFSLAEFNEYTSFYGDVKEYKLPGKNEIWNSFYLDLSKKPLHKILLDAMEETMIKKGFEGLFLDNLDNYGSYGKQKKQQPFLIEFLQTLKERFPNIFLIQNAGLELIEKTISFVDVLAIESVVTNYNFKNSTYQFRNKNESNAKISILKSIEEKHAIPLIAIEYANTTKNKRKIIRRIKKLKWNLFIGQIDLQKIPTFN